MNRLNVLMPKADDRQEAEYASEIVAKLNLSTKNVNQVKLGHRSMSPQSPRVPIDTCEGLYDKLKWDCEQLKEGWTEYRTFNFIVTAYHLYADWIDSVGTRKQRQRKNELPAQAQKLFFTLRDITNSSKHWKLDAGGRKKQIVSEVSKPIIADWYAYFIAGPVMYVSVDSARPSLPELANLTLECFDWLLQASEDTFPKLLLERLDNVFKPLH